MSDSSASRLREQNGDWEEQSRVTKIQGAMATPFFAIAAFFVLAALIAPKGVLGEAPAIFWIVGKFGFAIVFFLMGRHFRLAGKARSDSLSRRNER